MCVAVCLCMSMHGIFLSLRIWQLLSIFLWQDIYFINSMRIYTYKGPSCKHWLYKFLTGIFGEASIDIDKMRQNLGTKFDLWSQQSPLEIMAWYFAYRVSDSLTR